VIRSVLDGLVPVEQTVQAQSFDNQAEFVKPIWDYAKSAVSPTRIANGQAKLAANVTIFDALEAAYAPPREIVAAIWGMESSYGGFIGTDDAPRVLASQAAIGRRKDFNERRTAGDHAADRERLGDARPVPQGILCGRAGTDAVHAVEPASARARL
jgi:membrane-bound lytic murein transglycosylase B